MAKIILASHGGLSKGMKDSVSMIVGDLAKDIETYILLPGQNPEDFYQEVLKEAKECEEQILILCDIKGGSVHTALSKLAVLDNVMVFSGMNMGLVLDAVMKGLNGKLELAEANDLIEAAKDGMTVMNGVDHRLLHGQVAFSWKNAVEADCILIACDAVMKDDLRKKSIKMAKPSGVKLVIKSMDDAVKAINSGVTDKYKLLTVVESIKDAERLCKECNIKKLNLGGTKATAETRNISKAMNITPAEETILKGLCEAGVDVTIQMVPEDNPVNVEKVL